jgi:hypothetical protein
MSHFAIHRKYSNKYLYYKPNFTAIQATKHKYTHTPNLVKYIEEFPYEKPW